jgi:hypothetical protein
MAAQEMYDYLAVATPDVNYTLGAAPYTFAPQGVITEVGTKNQEIHVGDDGPGSEERVSYSDNSEFTVQFGMETMTAAESGTLMDWWHNSAIGNGIANTWKWQRADDGHTYVVRFDCDFPRERKAYDIYGVSNITLFVVGKIADP